MGQCQLNGWVVPKVTGSINHAGNYQRGLIVISENYLWVDAAGKLKINDTEPTSDPRRDGGGTIERMALKC